MLGIIRIPKPPLLLAGPLFLTGAANTLPPSNHDTDIDLDLHFFRIFTCC